MNQAETEKALELIFPEVIVAVITKADNKTNLAPVNFQAISTKYETPLTVCLGISNTSYSLRNILETKEFVVAFPDQTQLRDIIYCGTVSGRDTDKLADTNLKFADAKSVQPPLLTGALLNLECELKHQYKAGDFTIVVGQIAELHSNHSSGLKNIYSLGGTRYGTIKIDEVIQESR